MREVQDSRQTVVMMLCGMLLGAYITWFSVDTAFEISQQLRYVWAGHDAAVLFMVARRSIGHSALLAGVMLMMIRLWRARNEKGAWRYVFETLKIGLAVWSALWLSSTLGFAAVGFIPFSNVPIELLRGWRGFQLVNIGSLILSIPLFMIAFDFICRKLRETQLLCHRMAIILSVVAIFGVAMVAREFVVDGLGLHSRAAHHEAEEENQSPFDTFRLTSDEPGESIG